jgi:hypothetical protein
MLHWNFCGPLQVSGRSRFRQPIGVPAFRSITYQHKKSTAFTAQNDIVALQCLVKEIFAALHADE